MGRVVCVSGRHSLFFRFLTIIVDIPRVTLPAIDVAGYWGAGWPWWSPACLSSSFKKRQAKKERKLKKNLKTTSSSSLGSEVVSSTASTCFAVVHRIPDE